jgi:transcriptional regulator with XRE-family HTH domain
MTQWELAKRSDLTIRTISFIENNRRGMRARTAQRIARALGISTDELLGEPEAIEAGVGGVAATAGVRSEGRADADAPAVFPAAAPSPRSRAS